MEKETHFLKRIIDDEIASLESKTGNKICIERTSSTNLGIFIDWPSWNNVGFPKIIIDNSDISLDSVHVLHELIHLDTFFISKYPLVCSSKELHEIIHVFKNIPEDYIAHKIIYTDYGLNPVGEIFLDRDKFNTIRSDKQLASDLAQYYLFSEFHSQYKKRLPDFERKCKRQRFMAYQIAQKTIDCISSIAHRNKESYSSAVTQLINIFEPELYKQGFISLMYISNDQERWIWKHYQNET